LKLRKAVLFARDKFVYKSFPLKIAIISNIHNFKVVCSYTISFLFANFYYFSVSEKAFFQKRLLRCKTHIDDFIAFLTNPPKYAKIIYLLDEFL